MSERVAAPTLLLLGLAMIVLAAIGYLASSVGVAFAVLGAALAVLGACLHLLEGNVKLGPQGFEATFRQRAQVAIEVMQEASPQNVPLAREVIRLVDPTRESDMSTQQEKDNIRRLVHEVMAGMGELVTLQQALDSAELHGVAREQVVEIVEGVLGVVASGTPDEGTKAKVLAMIECAYQGKT